MSGKINVKSILAGHFRTMASTDGKISVGDYFTFLGVPLVVAGAALYLGFKLDKDIISLLVNFGAIFTALLLSVLVLVYDQESKLDDKANFAKVNNLAIDFLYDRKKELLKELYFNISFAVVLSLVLVAVCFLYSIAQNLGMAHPQGEVCLSMIYMALSSIAVFVASNALLTITMILKRIHALLIVE